MVGKKAPTFSEPETVPDLEAVEALLGDLRSLWQRASSAERQALLEPVVEQVSLDLEMKTVHKIVLAAGLGVLMAA